MHRANTDRFKYLMSVLHYKVNTGKLIVSYYRRPVIIAPWHKLFENLTYIFALLCLYAMVNLSFGKIAYFFLISIITSIVVLIASVSFVA